MLKNDFIQTSYLVETKHPVGELSFLVPTMMGPDENGVEQISIVPQKKFFELGTRRVKSKFNSELEDDLSRLHGISVEDEVNRALQREMEIGINRDLFSKYRELGEKSFMSSLSKWHLFVRKFFESFVPYFHVDPKTESDTVIKKILSTSSYILRKNRMKSPDFIVCDQRTFSVIAESKSFAFTSNNQVMEDYHSISLKGNINGRILVFVNPYLDSGILIGVRSDVNNPLVSIPHSEPVEETFTSDDWGHMTPVKHKVLSQKMVIVDSPNAENSFFFVPVSHKSLPFWKKILNLHS